MRIHPMIRALGFSAALAAASPGCMWAPELAGIRRDLERQMPGASFEKNVELSFGPVTLGIVRFIAAVIPGAGEARPWLKGISRVEIGVYDARADSVSGVRTPRRLQALIDAGWETAVRVHDDDEAVWVLYRPEGEDVREMFIVVLDRDELVLVKARGHLDRLVAAALEEAHERRGFAFHG